MKISTKGKYGLRAMIDLAQYSEQEAVSISSIAQRQKISMKYLESIVGMLNKAGLLQSRRGKDGGYRMARRPEEYPVSEILKLTEGTLAPVSCMDGEGCGPECELLANCLTRPMWNRLDEIIDEYLSSVSIQDLLDGRC